MISFISDFLNNHIRDLRTDPRLFFCHENINSYLPYNLQKDEIINIFKRKY